MKEYSTKKLQAVSYQLPAKQKASALILTLVLVGLVASLAFFVARSSVRETKLSSSGSASIAAYYAAEAGIEDGLARVASNRNIEVPTCKFGTNNKTDPLLPCDSGDGANFNSDLSIEDMALSSPKSWPVRVRMARFGANSALTNNDPKTTGGDTDLNKVIDPLIDSNDPLKGVKTPETNEYVYDLKISSKTSLSGKLDASNNPTDPGTDTTNLISKSGDSKEFTFDTSGSEVPSDMRIFWKCNRSNGTCKDGDSIIVQYLTYDPTTCKPEQDTTCLVKKEDVLDFTTYNRVWPLPFFQSTSTRIYKVNLKPVSSNNDFSGINFSAVAYKTQGGTNVPMDMKSDIVKIQSIGYFGGVKRRLEANVDKSSGSLLGLFDYAVYTGGTFSQP